MESGEEAAKTISSSQQSTDNMVEHFSNLVATVEAEAGYTPNEEELATPGLQATLADLVAKTSAAINAQVAIDNARMTRDTLLYTTKTGLVDVAMETKKYIRSVFKPRSPQSRQIDGLRFIRLKKDV